MGNTNIYVGDDLQVSVDYEIIDGEIQIVKVYPLPAMMEYIQGELDNMIDDLVEQEEGGALEARSDELSEQ